MKNVEGTWRFKYCKSQHSPGIKIALCASPSLHFKEESGSNCNDERHRSMKCNRERGLTRLSSPSASPRGHQFCSSTTEPLAECTLRKAMSKLAPRQTKPWLPLQNIICFSRFVNMVRRSSSSAQIAKKQNTNRDIPT